MKPYLEDKEAVLAELGSSMTGLTEEEAAARLSRDGYNRLKEGKKESLLKKFFGQLKDPMTIVLIAAAVISAITAIYAHDRPPRSSAAATRRPSTRTKSSGATCWCWRPGTPCPRTPAWWSAPP